jgi:hypothetical protein
VGVFGFLAARSSILRSLCMTGILAIAASGFPLRPSAHLPRQTKRLRAAPRAVVPFTSFSFGDVYTGDVISQIFVIKNEGNADLLIGDFKAECGCTIGRADRSIPPGKEGTVEVEVQTISQSGLINKFATLPTNDPDHPKIIFTMIANVLKGTPVRQGKYVGPIFLSPGSNASMYAQPGKKATTEFLVTADSAPVQILRVEGGTKQFASRIEVVQPGRIYKILVESIQIETGGLYTDQLRVVTDTPTLPAFSLDLNLRVYSKE